MDTEKLKQKILDLAIRGKLVPQDSNDESAEELIKKIQEEKAKLVKEGKIKASKEESIIFKGSDNCYYENDKEILFDEPLEVSNNIIWMKGKDFLFPMESTKPCGEEFQYIDIDSIDNKNNIINKKIIKSTNAPSRASRKTYPTSTLFSMVRPYLRNIAFVGEENVNAIASTGFFVCTPMPFVNPEYLFILMTSKYVVDGLNYFMKGDNSPSIIKGDIEKFLFPIPSLEYQNKVLGLLEKIMPKLNVLRNSQEELVNVVKVTKRKILDDIFSENSSYKSYYENEYFLGDLLPYEQPALYIVKSTIYDDKYDTPVLTPGKSFILGYTNEKEGVYHVNNSKVIIFDDFTTASRIIDFDFKVKSSAMKILKSSDETKFNIDYLYFLLQTLYVNNDTHKRYWISEFATKKVKVHTYDEQLKIVKTINDITTKLDYIIDSKI